MRPISELIWHCTATPEGREHTATEVDSWHRERGFKRSKPVGNLNLTSIGYHKLVHLDGSVSIGRDESEIGAHVAGHNTGTIGYVYVGGCDKAMKPKDTRTTAQKATMLRLTKEAIAKYKLKKVTGHNQYAAKACPSFDVRKDTLGQLV